MTSSKKKYYKLIKGDSPNTIVRGIFLLIYKNESGNFRSEEVKKNENAKKRRNKA